MEENLDNLRGNKFIAKTVGDTPRTCNLCLYNNDGGEYKGNCPYFSDIFNASRNDENMTKLDGKAPGNYCKEWEFGLVGED